MRRALLALALLLALAPAGALAAQPKTTLSDLEDEVMCDTCNVPLNVAESDRATQERQAIQRMIDRGLTKQQIKDRLRAQYGPAILATPEDKGFSLAVWWVPVAAVAIVLAIIATLLPRWRRRARDSVGEPEEQGPRLSDEENARLDRELARFDA